MGRDERFDTIDVQPEEYNGYTGQELIEGGPEILADDSRIDEDTEGNQGGRIFEREGEAAEESAFKESFLPGLHFADTEYDQESQKKTHPGQKVPVVHSGVGPDHCPQGVCYHHRPAEGIMEGNRCPELE